MQKDDDKVSTKNSIKGLVAVCLFFVFNLFIGNILALIGINTKDLSYFSRLLISLGIDLILVFSLILLFKNQFKKMFADMKENNKEYFKKYFKLWFVIMGVMAVSNISISFINGGNIANNEQSVRDMFNYAPVITYISGVFVAPFIEESVFRLGFRNIFKNNFLFIILSGLVFGSLHVLTSFTSPVDLLYLIPYCTPGFIFAYIMVKTNNVFASMALHSFHNGITMSLQVLLLLFN